MSITSSNLRFMVAISSVIPMTYKNWIKKKLVYTILVIPMQYLQANKNLFNSEYLPKLWPSLWVFMWNRNMQIHMHVFIAVTRECGYIESGFRKQSCWFVKSKHLTKKEHRFPLATFRYSLQFQATVKSFDTFSKIHTRLSVSYLNK